MAEKIFSQADRNQDGILNRAEFRTARLMTDNTVANLGRRGLIGRGHRPMSGGIQGGVLGQAGLVFNLSITDTNHVTQPQFTNYFRNAVARGDALWRQLYASNRRTNGRAYPRYGRGYGRGNHYGYAHRSYGGSRPAYSAGSTPTTHPAATTPTATNPAASGTTTGHTPTSTPAFAPSASFVVGSAASRLPAGVTFIGSGSGLGIVPSLNSSSSYIAGNHTSGNTTVPPLEPWQQPGLRPGSELQQLERPKRAQEPRPERAAPRD